MTKFVGAGEYIDDTQDYVNTGEWSPSIFVLMAPAAHNRQHDDSALDGCSMGSFQAEIRPGCVGPRPLQRSLDQDLVCKQCPVEFDG